MGQIPSSDAPTGTTNPTEATKLLKKPPPPDLPYLRTPLRAWSAVVAVSVAASFAQLPLMAWQTLQPVMLSDNVLCGASDATVDLDRIYNIGLGLAAVCNLFYGLMFDIIGPRALGLYGLTGTLVGFAVMAFSLQIPCAAPSTVLLWVSSLVTFIAAPATALAANCYMYLLSDDAYLVSAITNCNYVVASSYGLIIGTLNSSYGAHSYTFFYLMACCNVLAVVGIAYLIPTRSDFQALQQVEMAKQKAKAEGGKEGGGGGSKGEKLLRDDGSGGGSGELAAAPAPSALQYIAQQLSDAYTLCFRTSTLGLGGLLLVIHIFVLYMQQTLFLIEQYSYYQSLFGAATGQALQNAYSMIFTFFGLPVSLGYGAIADRAPSWATIAMWDATSLLFFACSILPFIGAQYASMLFLTALANVYYLVCPPLIMLYSPSELFGTLFGLLQAVIGILQIMLVYVEDAAFAALMPGDGREAGRVVMKLILWTALLFVFALANQWAWRTKPPPALGTVTMEVVYSAKRG